MLREASHDVNPDAMTSIVHQLTHPMGCLEEVEQIIRTPNQQPHPMVRHQEAVGKNIIPQFNGLGKASTQTCQHDHNIHP
jgi:hypothetical protein